MLKEKLLEDLKQSMKEKNTNRKNVVQMVRAGILQVEKDKGIQLEDAQVLEIIAKELKKRKDSLADFEKANREDLINQVNEEIDLDDDDFLLISSLLLTNDYSFDPLYIFFNPSEDELNNYLNEFNNLYQLDKNTSTAFSKYIFDNYSRNSRCLFAVITSYFYKEDTFLRLAKKYMKPVDGTDDYQNMKLLAFFLHFLIRCFINTYIDKEKRIGR